MRNLLALLAATCLVLAGVGWFLGWYRVQSVPASSGHQQITIDFDKKKAGHDVKEGAEKALEKGAELKDSLDKRREQESSSPADAIKPDPTTKTPARLPY